MVNLRIHLTDDVFDALKALSNKELRSINDQLLYILRQELQKSGYLPATTYSQQPLTVTSIDSSGK